MSFDAPGRRADPESFDAVILALPFTKLRQVKGLDRLKLSAEKLKCIRELGMGRTPRSWGTTSRVWRSPGVRACPRHRMATFFPISGSRIFGRRAARQPGEAGILTDFLGGNAGTDRREVRARHLPRRPCQDVAEDGRKSRPGGGHVLVLELLSLHARQLRQRQSRTIHHDVGGGARNPLLTAACNLPASIPAATFLAL